MLEGNLSLTATNIQNIRQYNYPWLAKRNILSVLNDYKRLITDNNASIL